MHAIRKCAFWIFIKTSLNTGNVKLLFDKGYWTRPTTATKRTHFINVLTQKKMYNSFNIKDRDKF